MARQQGTDIENKFIRGYVTDTTALNFPKDACTDALNVVFDSTGRITRRYGFDTETSYTTDSVSLSAGDAYASFVWEAVSGDGNISFLVIQQGEVISFYDISSSAEVSGNKLSAEINLTTSFLVSESNEDPAEYLCQFASGNGDLFIVNGACYPFYVSYDADTEQFTSTQITLKYRDFEGLDDGLDDDERVSSSVAGMETTYQEHYYNLINQGWGSTDALAQWDTDRSDMPSNRDYIGLYRADDFDAFANSAVTANDPGSRLAPKGHFILNVGEDDRQTALDDEGFTFYLPGGSTTALVNPDEGTIFTDFANNSHLAFDRVLVTVIPTTECAFTGLVNNAYIGKDYGAGNEKTVNKVILYPAVNGIVPPPEGFLHNDNFNLTITIYGNNSTPASGTDGTSLGSVTLTTDQTDLLTIESNDTTTAYRYIWAYFVPASSDTIYVAEMQIYSGLLSFESATCTSFYAGRVFYGGIANDKISNNIYFSQIIENEEQYGRCYQKNDPTSEDLPDLLPDDGGFIKIPEMGTLKRLYAYQNALFCFASNGVWLIQGTSGALFQATSYQVKKISSIGMDSPYSLVSIKGLPAWWGEDGIYTVQFDANYDSFSLVSLTDDIIEIYYNTVPLNNRKYIKSDYDNVNQIAYWLLSENSDLGTDAYRYDTILCMDAKSRAFYKWEISDGPIVRTINFIKAADRTTDSKLKFMIHQNYDASTADQTFAEVLNENYLDWEDEGSEVDYSSYFITGYKLDGDTQKFFQSNYVFVFLEQESNASCYVQGLYDFTNATSSGKWSTQQQIYNSSLSTRDINFRRLKIRGKGRALQLRFESESQKPFTIIGWSIFETVNAGL